MIPHILKIIADELAKLSKNVQEASQLNLNEFDNSLNYGKQNQPKLRGNLSYIHVLNMYLTSSILGVKIYNHSYLELIFTFLDKCEMQNNNEQVNSAIVDDTKIMLFNVYENIINNTKFLLNNHDFFTKNIFPKFCEKFLNNPEADIRFNCLKLFIEILAQITSDSHIYDDKKPYGKFINDFIMKNIIPNVKQLLSEQETIVFFALKLINLLVEKNTIFIPQLKKYKFIQHFFEFYAVDHKKLTKNTLKIIS